MSINPLDDRIIFSPKDVKEGFRPLGKDVGKETYILGAFNPGVTRLRNGNILLMVRVAEALKNPIAKGYVLTPRMDFKKKKFVLDNYPKKLVDFKDPRHLEMIQENKSRAMRLTSISWILPVELSEDGKEIIKVHYDKVILPSFDYQELGVEDPRITKIENKYYMALVGVGFNNVCICLYESIDGLNYKPKGKIFEHHNKDVVLFPKKIKGKYFALTRPEGSEIYLAYPSESNLLAGKCINIAESIDLEYWKPGEKNVLTLRKDSLINKKIGAGTPPINIKINRKEYFLELFHGVEYSKDKVGIYRTFAALFDKNDPSRIVKVKYEPFLEYNPKLRKQIKGNIFLKKDVVFTTGIVEHNDKYLVFSGELDAAVRMTTFPVNDVKNFLR
jgi:predicted GH43/DUF377 family glycosyl hydrolase